MVTVESWDYVWTPVILPPQSASQQLHRAVKLSGLGLSKFIERKEKKKICPGTDSPFNLASVKHN